MKILLAFPRPLVPADTGGKIRSLQIFSRLSERAEIHAISQANPDVDGVAIREMKQVFASYTPIFWKESVKYTPQFYLDLAKNNFSRMPYFIAKFCRPEFIRGLATLAASQRFDLLCCDFLQTATPALELSIRPRVVFEHNVEYKLRKRQWEAEKAPFKKWVFGAEWRKTRNVEARVCQSFDHIISVSEEDRLAIAQDFHVKNVSTIPTGVDGDYFRPQAIPEQPGRLVFVGSMDWYPNEDGVLWFLSEIFPLIQKQIPRASFTIVGRNPSARLTSALSGFRGVTLTGRVDDVRPYIAQAEVVVVPLRVGGGTRIKIPEAMAMSKPLVSTRIGAEGLDFRDGIELFVEDQQQEFAKVVVDLLRNCSLRDEVGKAARERVLLDHDWNSVTDRVEEILIGIKKDQRLFSGSVSPSRNTHASRFD
jgi:polysaccharide biosynthesis protein PslH